MFLQLVEQLVRMGVESFIPFEYARYLRLVNLIESSTFVFIRESDDDGNRSISITAARVVIVYQPLCC